MNKLTFIALLLLLLSACSVSVPTFYKADVKQGTLLNQAKVSQLQLGMTKSQVQNLIGSPSIIDPFHNNQWDYINHSTLHRKDDIHSRLTLIFKNDLLADIGIQKNIPTTLKKPKKTD